MNLIYCVLKIDSICFLQRLLIFCTRMNCMRIKFLTVIVAVILSMASYAKNDFVCKLVLYKNSCWDGYEVTVSVYDPYVKPKKNKATLVVKKNKFEAAVEFPCKNREYVTLESKFSPTIWEGKENEIYKSRKTWVIPTEIDDKATDWRINLCFPADFQGVPQPTGALRDCKCKRDELIKIEDTSSKKKTKKK